MCTLQASYNLTGAYLSPTNSTLTKRIQTALQKALGTNVNATLLRVTTAGGAADSSPSPSDGLTGPSLTPADGSIAGELSPAFSCAAQLIDLLLRLLQNPSMQPSNSACLIHYHRQA